jgi:hypothetical protein
MVTAFILSDDPFCGADDGAGERRTLLPSIEETLLSRLLKGMAMVQRKRKVLQLINWLNKLIFTTDESLKDIHSGTLILMSRSQ